MVMIDSHAHVAFSAFDGLRDKVIARAREAGVVGWIEIGTDIVQSRKSVALAQDCEDVFATVGVHPDDVGSLTEKDWVELERMLDEERVVAVGEVGFDFYREENPGFCVQKEALERFADLAREKSLPIVFHVRDGKDASAHEAMLDFLKTQDGIRGVMHTYSGSVEQARRYLDLGMCLSFSGVVTFKNAQENREVAKIVPFDRFLIETDCPFLAPEPYRGQQNEPAYVKLVAEKLAEVRSVSVEDVVARSMENTRRLFGI